MPPVGSKKRNTGRVVAGSEKLIGSSIHDLDDLHIEAKNSKRRLCTSKGKLKSLSGKKRHSYSDSRFQPDLLSAITCPPVRRYPKGFLYDYRRVECRLS